MANNENVSKGFYHLNWVQRIGFGSGDLAQNLIYQTIGMYLLLFYTNVFGIDPKAAAFMFLIVRLVDVLWDPLVGTFVDKHDMPCVQEFVPLHKNAKCGRSVHLRSPEIFGYVYEMPLYGRDHRLQSVLDVRHGTLQNYVRGIVEEPVLVKSEDVEHSLVGILRRERARKGCGGNEQGEYEGGEGFHEL